MNDEYLTSNTAIAYPFKEDAVGLYRESAPELPGLPQDVFIDASFEVPATLSQLYLRRCTRNSPTNAFFVIGTVTGESVTVDVTIEGTYTVGYVSDDGITAWIVMDSEALRRYLTTFSGIREYALNLPFEPGTTAIADLKVQSISLYNHGPDELPDGDPVIGDVSLLSGHNVAIDIDSLPENDISPIEIVAMPGAGLGQLPCDTFTAGYTNVPRGMTPNKGNIQIDGDPCYAIVPHPGTGVFQIQGHCQACCTCEDYTDMLTVITDLCTRAMAIKADLDRGREQYELGVTEFNQFIAPTYTRTYMKAHGMRGSDWEIGNPRRGSPNWSRVVIVFGNQRSNPVTVKWSAFYIHPISTVTIEDVSWEYDGTGGKTTLGGPLPTIAKNMTLSVTILASVTRDEWEANPEWRVSLQATMVDAIAAETDSHSQVLVFT